MKRRHALNIAYVGLCIALVGAISPNSDAQTVERTTIEVNDDASLQAAFRNVAPGTTIKIAPGEYAPGISLTGLEGADGAWIIIEGADRYDRPTFTGGSTAWHLIDCSYVALRNLNVKGQSGNGINIDDGGDYSTPSHHIFLGTIEVSDIGPQGNHDGIKLSGVDDFMVRGCKFEGWGGQAVDMVGCHRGMIEQCWFFGKEGFSQTTGPQAKGGSSDITIRHCSFDQAAQRGVNLGGSTGREFFRPLDAAYEAKDITVERCTFRGCMAPIAFVGVDGAVVRYNTIVYPEKWICRILQETRDPEFAPCRDGCFEKNLIVFRRSEVQTFVNIGPGTQPETFQFHDNYWYCEDVPERSRPDLPTTEENGVYGRDPQLEVIGRLGIVPRENNHIANSYGANSFDPEDDTEFQQ